MPHGLSLGKRSRGIAVPCPEGRPRCGPQSGGRHRSQSHCHPAQRKGREGIYRWCLDEAPRAGAQHPPWHGVLSPHWLLQSCPSSCPLRTSRKPPFSAFTRSALPCCVTWGKCPASSGPQLCNVMGLVNTGCFLGVSQEFCSVTQCRPALTWVEPHSQGWSHSQRSGWCRSCPGPGCPGSSACPSPRGRRRS